MSEIENPVSTSTEKILNAIHRILISKNAEVNSLSTLNLVLQSLSDLISAKKYDMTHHFLEIIRTCLQETNIQVTIELINVISFFLKNIENHESTLISIKIFSTFLMNYLTDEIKYSLFFLYGNKKYKQNVNHFLVKMLCDDKDFLFRFSSDKKNVLLEFVCENVPFIFMNYDIVKVFLFFVGNDLNLSNNYDLNNNATKYNDSNNSAENINLNNNNTTDNSKSNNNVDNFINKSNDNAVNTNDNSNYNIFENVSKYEINNKKEYEEKVQKLCYKITKYFCEITSFSKIQEIRDFFRLIIQNLNFQTLEKVTLLKTLSVMLNKERILKIAYKKNETLLNIKNLNQILSDCLKEEYSDSLKIILDSCPPDLITKDLDSFFQEICVIYEEKSENYDFVLLKSIIRSIGLSKFYYSLKKNCRNVSKFIEVLKKSQNSDLELFIDIFGDEPDKIFIFNIFPTICYFSTDNNNQINLIMKIIRKEISYCSDKRIIFSICNGLDCLIKSHRKNISSNLIMNNQISKESSLNIIQTIIKSKIVIDLIVKYLEIKNEEIKKVCETILSCYENLNSSADFNECLSIANELVDLKLNNTNLNSITDYKNINSITDLNEIVECLKNANESVDFKYFGENQIISSCKNLIDFITIVEMFSKFISPDFILTSKILNMCLSKNKKIQKSAYSLLYSLTKNKKLNTCICSILLSNEYLKTPDCAQKYRIMTLYELYKNCNFCDEKTNFFKKIILEFIISLKKNSAKTRKASVEIISLMINEKTYKEFLKAILIGFESEETQIVNGCITCLSLLIKNKQEFIIRNLNLVLDKSKVLKNKSKEFFKCSIELYKTILIEIKELDDKTKREFMKLIGEYGNKGGSKIVDYLKKIVVEIKESDVNIPLAPELVKISKLKFKRNGKLALNISKAGKVEIINTRKIESDDDDSD